LEDGTFSDDKENAGIPQILERTLAFPLSEIAEEEQGQQENPAQQ